jgi:hypothetical protein
MKSDFAAAHLHLDRACHYLRGDDETSTAALAALDLVIEAVAAARYARPEAEVLPFPGTPKRPLPPIAS